MRSQRYFSPAGRDDSSLVTGRFQPWSVQLVADGRDPKLSSGLVSQLYSIVEGNTFIKHPPNPGQQTRLFLPLAVRFICVSHHLLFSPHQLLSPFDLHFMSFHIICWNLYACCSLSAVLYLLFSISCSVRLLFSLSAVLSLLFSLCCSLRVLISLSDLFLAF